MKKASLIATAGLSLASTAAADFIGFSGEVAQYDDGTVIWAVVNVYADFDDETNAVLNVFNSDIRMHDAQGFHHNDLADPQGGSWKPSFSFDIPGVYDSNRDSYVTIGYGVGASAALNQTALDPGFDPSIGPFVPLNAGWFNLTPDNAQYAVGGSVHVGQFVVNSDRWTGSNGYIFWFEAEIGYNNGPGTAVSFGEGEFIVFPTPGALALIGLGGLTIRRRRG